MKPVERQKMCPNCDGRIPQESTQCPYCFAALQTDPSSSNKTAAPMTNDPLSALYPPPYASSESKVTTKALPMNEVETQTDTTPFWPILMLVLGSNLFTVGILQFFFSDHGVLRLEMNASYWFLMILVAAPLFYFGMKGFSPKNQP